MTAYDADLAASGMPTQDTINAEEALQHAVSTTRATEFENQIIIQRQQQQNQSRTSTSANRERMAPTSSDSTAITGAEDQPIEVAIYLRSQGRWQNSQPNSRDLGLGLAQLKFIWLVISCTNKPLFCTTGFCVPHERKSRVNSNCNSNSNKIIITTR